MRKIILLLFSLSLFYGCSEVHFIKDKTIRENVEKRFEYRKKFAKNREDQLFGIFNDNLSNEETEALQFLYAYMPLCDLADYNGDYFLKHVRASFEARNSFMYSSKVPEDLFRHFVLPYRVNNENLDTARLVFLKELKPRLQGMSMKEAVLEVNHWCHEKVNYAPTDIRTSGPLSLVKTSWGRCGEESTFTVTAMRAVGIPARQVYTPRWAHSDDNHAWVEVWVDGKWSYLGACEPEPDLNMGWFTEPARRAMLVHTKVFGDYQSEDEVVEKTDNFTEINVVDNYADVKKIFVAVKDENGNAVKDAKVEYGLYNYAEFYSIATKITDEKGFSFLTTGLGDLLIWVSKNKNYTGQKVSVNATDTLFLELGKGFIGDRIADINMVPPIEKDPYSVDASMKKLNDIRLAKEDSIRYAYRATFIDSLEVTSLAESKNINKNTSWSSIKNSQGNWKEIQEFIKKSNSGFELNLLELIASKDLRDAKSSILIDHIENTIAKFPIEAYSSKEIYLKYVLNPRIKNEWLTAYRGYLQEQFSSKLKGSRLEKVELTRSWILEKVEINESENYYSLPITPKGVHELKISNEESRDVFFVALCRSLGIPSRLEPAEKTPQYYSGDKWLNVYFKKEVKEQPIMGYLELNMSSESIKFDPNYFKHFSIGKLSNGSYESLDFGWGNKLSNLSSKIDLEVGDYRSITGKRGVDGTVFVSLNHFTIKENQVTNIGLKFRNPEVESKIQGKLNLNTNILDSNNENISLSKLAKKNAILLMWVEPGKEPTRHLMEEFKGAKTAYNTWGGHVSILQSEEVSDESLSADFFANMPNDFSVYKDKNDALLKAAKKELKISGKIEKPLIMVLTPEGEIIFSSRGYKIGIHEHLLKLLNK